ncbi:MAG TPA: DUF6526 family protein [Gemmatimonadaceae bacterium]
MSRTTPRPRPAQAYANHRRYFPLYHYFALPVVAVHAIVTIVRAVREPSLWNGWVALVALAIAAGLVALRASTLIVQNRLIALEMGLRLTAVLPPEQRMRIPELRVRQLLGLRFASDEELPALVDRCLQGELRTADEVKKQVQHWRADWLRA